MLVDIYTDWREAVSFIPFFHILLGTFLSLYMWLYVLYAPV